jgi:glucosamine-6-phosphate deaminase
MGIGTIMSARSIVLLASGRSKAEPVRGMVRGPITPRLPASVLQLHPDVIVILDEEAASLL